ncbi:hypothetical protein J1N10_04965 [Carboxylicivirga sp. A043]|uniref:hypothetical protein n=1 Tax=Carboxylicivirga litoralis TaxID=2816963 RepID=UPI0021CB7B99|nr:hypothetical protein [Carboxylicivirga sp. A043]MCU4155314.1 hypothetical protein [Carboxylicivirga sp. A043]
MFKTVKICWLSFVLASFLFLFLSLNFGRQFLLPISVFTFSLLLLFFRFTVIVDEEWIEYSIGIGIVIGRYAITDVANCKVMDNLPPNKWFRHRYFKSFLFSGFNLIELHLKNGESHLLPTNAPHSLSRFISEMCRKSSTIKA